MWQNPLLPPHLFVQALLLGSAVLLPLSIFTNVISIHSAPAEQPLTCLAHASYLIGSDGEAAVVDPQRDVDEYIAEARAHQLNIKYIIETHLHADFVSGHQELAKRLGATIVFGQKAGASFAHQAVKDGDEIKLGKLILRFLETPGHTPESICILVIDPSSPEQAQKILTGDTLFIGDVGRPDLAGGKGFTPQQMAGLMYESLHGKLLTLPDETEVYPAHVGVQGVVVLKVLLGADGQIQRMLIRSLSRLTSSKESRHQFTPAQQPPLELHSPAASTFTEPVSSVTDNTTRTLEYARRDS